jgi:predicted enzyme related to lactoylglutathione lyase
MVKFSNVAGIVLYTADMERAHKFYTEVLGLVVVESEPSFATLQAENMQIYLHFTENPPKSLKGKMVKIPQVSFKVDDIDAAYKHLQDAKVNITREIVEYNPTTFVFNFLDPDGNSLACESNQRKNV